jgi:hypothetical protein
LALAIIHLLTQGFYRLDVRRALHSVNWDGVHRYGPIRNNLDEWKNVEFVVWLSGDPAADYHAYISVIRTELLSSRTGLTWIILNWRRLWRMIFNARVSIHFKVVYRRSSGVSLSWHPYTDQSMILILLPMKS